MPQSINFPNQTRADIIARTKASGQLILERSNPIRVLVNDIKPSPNDPSVFTPVVDDFDELKDKIQRIANEVASLSPEEAAELNLYLQRKYGT